MYSLKFPKEKYYILWERESVMENLSCQSQHLSDGTYLLKFSQSL